MSASFERVPENTADAVRDLQDRIGRMARTAFAISGVMLAAAFIGDIAQKGFPPQAPSAGRRVHIVAVVALLIVWRVCRGKTMPVRVVEPLDAALTIGMCVGWALLGVGAPQTEPVEFHIILATTYTLVFRSVIVPSGFRRTLWISAVAALPTAIVFGMRRMPFVADASPERTRWFVIYALIWCAIAVTMAALNSRQLFGLRQHIRAVRRLGQYTLEDKIGEGGMGVVYRATHALLRRPAAIKLLLPGRAGERDLARFEREVQFTSRLAHPNTISIFDYGRTADGVFYYVMEYLDGFDLEHLVKHEGPLPSPRVIRILAQAAGALSEAHALGLIHRDIKPANIILTERIDEPDVVKVVDFGLVRTQRQSPDDLALTHGDAITGTPLYLAPEAITAPDTIDARTDLYALGAVGYFLLTGQHVFEASSIVEVCSKHLLATPIPPSQRLANPIASDLETLILSCLAKAREQRPASAEALREALLACADADRYQVAAARHWWAERGALLRARRPTPTDQSLATMAIDLRARR